MSPFVDAALAVPIWVYGAIFAAGTILTFVVLAAVRDIQREDEIDAAMADYAEWSGAYLPFRPDPTPPRARAWHTVCRRYRSWRAWRRIVRKSGGCR
jgi:hypothetical protein